MSTQAQELTPGQKAWQTRLRRAAAAGEAIATCEETIEEKRARWQREYDERCKRVGYPQKGGDCDPDVWRAEGFDAKADHILQSWGKPWRPAGYDRWVRERRRGALHAERKRSDKKGGTGRRVWTF